MREVKICTNSSDTLVIVALVLLIAVVCAGIVYHYRGAGGAVESELDNAARLNSELASETRQLQIDLATHSARIKNVSERLGDSRKRIEHVYTSLGEAANDTDRAEEIVRECLEIIKAVKTQR